MDFSEYAYLSNDSETDYSDDDGSDEKDAIHNKAQKDIHDLREGIKRLLQTSQEDDQQASEGKATGEEGGEGVKGREGEGNEGVAFYDEQEDDANQDWVDKNLRVQAKEGERQSDAALSCPGCFTLVCLDCQQHAKYTTQYRAMFVVNCRLNENQQLKAQGTTFVPVQCGECAPYEPSPHTKWRAIRMLACCGFAACSKGHSEVIKRFKDRQGAWDSEKYE